MGRSGNSSTESTGTVKRLVQDRGFGFIRTTDGVEYFFHRSSCDNYEGLHEGSRVSFRIGSGPKGPRAENVVTLP
jgi:CspA family cold shock protein